MDQGASAEKRREAQEFNEGEYEIRRLEKIRPDILPQRRDNSGPELQPCA